MTPTIRLTLGVVSAGALALSGGVAYAKLRLWRRKDAAEIERLRRLDINRRGRISAGRILDLVELETAGGKSRLLVYQYEVGGVTYEAAQDVTTLPEIAAVAQFLPGQITSVKFDPRRPANSIFVCEEWRGLPKEAENLGLNTQQPQDHNLAFKG